MPEFQRKSTASEEALLGEVVAGRYKILKQIGSGGMGSVFVAEHLTTGRRVALKTLLPGLGKIEDVARRFEREAKAACMLHHPNVVDVMDFGTLADDTLFMVMEYVRGRGLGDILEKGPLDPERALRIGRQVLEALGAAHAVGIIHRDLKPDNVMLVDVGESEGERDVVKLLDFGIARIVGEAEAKIGGGNLTQAGVAFGTPDYMAPEQALGDKVDGRADLYGMGVMLFEMIAGRKPFESEDRMAVVRMHVSAKPPKLRDVTPADITITAEMEALMTQALAKRRAERFSDAAAMIVSLDRALASFRRASGRAPASALSERLLTTGPLRDAALWARRPKIVRRVVIGLPMLTLAIVIVGLWLGGVDLTPDPPGPPIALPGLAVGLVAADASAGPPRTELLAAAHENFASGRRIEALAAYEQALSADPRLATNAQLTENLLTMLDDEDHALALAALELLGRRFGIRAHDAIIARASSAVDIASRHRAFAIAEDASIVERIDRVQSYGLDLEQGETCQQRQATVAKLRALGDPRAVPLLEAAIERRAGPRSKKRVNACLVADARAAIAALRARQR